MSASTFDPARKHTFYFRCSRDGSKTIYFVDSSGVAKDVSLYEFNLQIKVRPQWAVNVLEWLNADIVRPSASSIRIDITDTDSAVLPNEYYLQLNVTNPSGSLKTWIAGRAVFHNGEFDGVPENTESLTQPVYENGEAVYLYITDSVDETISVLTQTTTATLTPSPTYDAFELTAQSTALVIANPSTDYPNFDGFIIRIKDNATARAISFGNKYRAQSVAFPASTTAGKVHIIIAIYDSATDKYDTKVSIEV